MSAALVRLTSRDLPEDAENTDEVTLLLLLADFLLSLSGMPYVTGTNAAAFLDCFLGAVTVSELPICVCCLAILALVCDRDSFLMREAYKNTTNYINISSSSSSRSGANSAHVFKLPTVEVSVKYSQWP